MSKKTYLAPLILALVLLVNVGAYALETKKVKDAVDTIITNNLDLEISNLTGSTTPLSVQASTYQLVFGEKFKELKDDQADHQKEQARFQVELSAYEMLYNYWLLTKVAEVSQHSVSQAEKELALIKHKKEEGLVSEIQVLNSEMKLNNAIAQYERNLFNLELLELQLNQHLEEELKDRISLEVPKFTELSSSEYDPEDVYASLYNHHDAVKAIQETITTYTYFVENVGLTTYELEFKNYYQNEIEVAKLRKQQTQKSIELLSYSYAEQFRRLSRELSLSNSNLDKANLLYEKALVMYEQGMITETDLKGYSLSTYQANLQLLQAQKEYYVLKEKFRLFKNGFLPRM